VSSQLLESPVCRVAVLTGLFCSAAWEKPTCPSMTDHAKYFGADCACYDPTKSVDTNASDEYCSCEYWWKWGGDNRCVDCCGDKPDGYSESDTTKTVAAQTCATAAPIVGYQGGYCTCERWSAGMGGELRKCKRGDQTCTREMCGMSQYYRYHSSKPAGYPCPSEYT
jgi:hypothetical protein